MRALLLTRIWIVVAVLLASGCSANPFRDSGLEADPSDLPDDNGRLPDRKHVKPGPGDGGEDEAPWGIPGGAHVFTLKEDREVAGRHLGVGSRVWGIELRDRWLRYPEYAEAIYYRSDFAFLRRAGELRLTRVDLKTNQEEPTPFDWVSHEYLKAPFAGGPDEGDASLLQISPLDEAGRVVATWHRARWAKEMAGGGWVVRHVTPDKQDVDVVYDRAGKAKTPELPPLESFGDRFFVRVDPKRELYWPIFANGVIVPKPGELLGLGKAPWDYEGRWTWVAHWTTPQGERVMTVADDREPAAILASRESTPFLDLAVGLYHDAKARETRTYWIGQPAGAPGYQVWDSSGYQPFHKFFPSVAAARGALSGWEDKVRTEMNAEYDRWVAAQAATKAAAEKAAWEGQQASVARANALLREKKFEAACEAAPAWDQKLIAKIVVAAVDAGDTEWLTIGLLNTALDNAQPDEANRIRNKVPGHHDGRYSSSYNSSYYDVLKSAPSDPSGYQALHDHLEAVRRQNLDAWLRGAQKWGGELR